MPDAPDAAGEGRLNLPGLRERLEVHADYVLAEGAFQVRSVTAELLREASAALLSSAEGREEASRSCSGATPSALPQGAEGQPGWQPIETAPHKGLFLAIDKGWEIRRCWRHNPSSRTDEILTWKRNGRFRATHWMPLPEPPAAAQPRTETDAPSASPSGSGSQRGDAG